MMTKLLGILLIISVTTSIFSEETTPFRRYYDNGKPKILGFHLDKTGKQHGEWTYYDKNGRVLKVENYKDGVLDTNKVKRKVKLDTNKVKKKVNKVKIPKIEMVLIKAGTFMMGSSDTETDRDSSEGPQHQVTITKDFYLGKYEVTQGQWEAVMGSWPHRNPSKRFGMSASHPAYYISWNDINCVDGFLDKLNGASGCDTSVLPTDTSIRYHPDNVPSGCYRLPTEAEWEYSVRAGTSTRFSYGDDEAYTQLGDYAWYNSNSGNETHPGGQKLSNPWGLYDMHGNVYEWVYDWYARYSTDSQNDPSGPTTGSARLIRGGSSRYVAKYQRSAERDAPYPWIRNRHIGFRLVLVK